MESGQLKGDVQAPSVSIVDGASVNGSVTMTGSDRSLHHRRSTDKRPGSQMETGRALVTGSR
jgi:cytoskeletal protein CcmA (bactofilin family)